MKNSGENKKKTWSYKTLGLVLLAVLSVLSFVIGGTSSTFINLQKWFADNNEIGKKTKTENTDGTTTLSLTVTGDVTTTTAKANVVVVFDTSNSMSSNTNAGGYNATNSTSSTGLYGLVEGEYLSLTRRTVSGSYHYYYTKGGTEHEYTGQRYSWDNNQERLEAAKYAVNMLGSSLLAYNTKEGYANDTIQMALVNFATNANVVGANTNNGITTSKDTFESRVNGLSYYDSSSPRAATNWEEALTLANTINFGDSDPTYIIFVSDGNPTFRSTRDVVMGDGVLHTYTDDGRHYNTYNVYGTGSESSTENINRCYYAALPASKAIVDARKELYSIGIYSRSLDRVKTLITTAGAPEGNYFPAGDTDDLVDALNKIMEDIQKAGISNATINDPTTNQVATSSSIANLLDIEKDNEGKPIFTYYRTVNGTRTEWKSTDTPAPPAAEFTEDGTVKWDLTSLRLLDDDVTYEVTFNVYPSQYTYDLIADLRNGTKDYNNDNDVPPEVRQYLHKDGNNYTLDTNTRNADGTSTATITYTDTRTDDGVQTFTYTNPTPVVTNASEMDVEKVWLNKEDKKFIPDNLGLKMNLIRDNVDTGLQLLISKDGEWKDDVAIATGLMRTKTNSETGKQYIEVLDPGHDYTLTEATIIDVDACDLEDLDNPELDLDTCRPKNYKGYQWELQIETVHPMIINGQLVTLIEVPTNEIPSGMTSSDEVYSYNGHTFYRFNGKVYYDKTVPTTGTDQTNAQLSAYNIRKSNFNFAKKVEGDPVGGELFNFTFKINDSNIDETTIPAGATDEDKMNNYSVWFSVCDPEKLAAAGHKCEDPDTDDFKISDYLEKDITTSATPEIKDGNATGYYYALDNTDITLTIKDGWNVRVTNLGTGSTYTVTESAPESPFELTDIDGTVIVSVPELPANAVETADGVYDVNGVEYRRVTEKDAAGVERTVYQYTYEPSTNVQNRTITGAIVAPNNSYGVTFTNTYPKTHLTVTKDWHVADAAMKPVEVTLYRSVSGGEKKKVTQDGLTNPVILNADNEWTYVFDKLDLYDANNNVYDYFTEESEITGGIYVTTYAGKEDIVVSATDIPANTESIDVNVTIGTETQVVTLNKENNWRVTIPEVEYVNEDGTVKYVSVRSNSSAEIHYALTNKTNTITNEERVNISGTKTWTDANDQDGLRPETITIHLNAGGTGIAETTVRPAQDGSWTYAFNNYPKYKYDEATKSYVEIVYTITEDTVANYTTDIPEGSFDVTNTHIPFETTVTVIKHWDDNNNRDNLRPESVKFKVTDDKRLMIPGFTDNTELSLTEGADGNWVFTKTGLPRRAAGQEITYSVVEITRPTGYTAASDNEPKVSVEKSATQLGAQTFTIEYTNKHIPSTVPISGTKIWNDNNDQDGLRPTSLTVELIGTVYAEDGKTVLETINTGKSVTLPNADGSWTYDFGNMPEYQEGYVGRHITYSVKETAVPAGYTETQVENTYNIQNSHTPETITKSGTKTWEDNNNQDGKRPTSITVQLTGKITVTNTDGSTTEQTVETRTIDVVPNAQGAWSYSFAGLPRYANHGQEIVYTVTDTVNGYSATDNSMNLVNTLIPETVDVEGEKIWEDANNQDGIRPQSITVQLVGQVLDTDGETVLATIDTTGKTAVLSDEAGWTYKFEDLQKNMNLGTATEPDVREITYTVTDSVTGYTTTSEGYNVKNTHVPETVEFNGLKDWVDNNNQDGKRPTSITIRLTGTITKDGQTIPAEHSQTITLTAENATEDDDNKWAYEFEPAPKYQDGIEINYTITEDEVADYTTVVAEDGTITNTHIPGKTSVSGSKTWDDANNQDGKRPTSISITLTGTVKYEKDGREVTEVVRPAETITVTEADNWSWSWPELEQYDNGHEIIYTITEKQVSEYNEPVVDGYNVTNTHTPETTKVEGSKTWTDADDQDGLRPGSIDITLHAVVKYTNEEGQEVTKAAPDDGKVKTVTEADGWKWSWDPLPKYYQGHEIEYSITEGEVNYYEADVTGYNVENTHNPFETTVTVIKNWNDGNNQDGLRPDAITFRVADDKGLMIPGFTDETELRLVASEGNVWTYTKTGLPRRAAGKEITYSVVEISRPEGYTPASENEPNVTEEVNAETNAKTFTIEYTNEHTPATVDVNGSKDWDDDGDRDGLRPTSINITLTGTVTYEKDGQEVTEPVKDAETKTVTAADNWSWSWPALPKYNNGHEITYTISEEKVNGYNDPVVDGYNVKNTHVPDETSVTITKVWADDNNRDLLRPTQVLITLYANGTEYGQYPVTIDDATDANTWAVTIDHLPLRANGQVITYTAQEKVTDTETDVPEGYEQSFSGTTVTNTHTPAETEVSGKKVWEDDGDRDGARPDSITINVYDEDDKTTIVKSETVSGNNTDKEWSYTITGLKKYKNVGNERKEINYVVDEELPAGYTKTVDGTTITNTYNTEKKNIPVSKTWVDEKGENYRPTSITVTLLADGEPVSIEGLTNPVVLSEDNEWKHTFENLPVNKDHGTGTVTYTVEETITDQIRDYYDVSYPETGEDEGLVIVNTIKNLSKNIPVIKVWSDENNRDDARPTSVTFNLEGRVPSETEPVHTDTITLTLDENLDPNDPNSWKGEFTNAPIFWQGTWITYTVSEAEIAGYTAISNETAADGTVTITNKHELTTIDFTATKVWSDNEDNDGKRPESVEITLYADGVEKETKTATADKNWQVTFEGLVKYAEGEVGREIVYTVAEKEENIPEGYTPNVTGNTITNTHEPLTISYKVTKNWEDFDNNDGKRPDHITVRLVGKVGDTVVTEEVKDVYEINEGFEDEPWTYAFTNLPKYFNKELVQYTLTEDEVDLYETDKITFVENKEDTTEITNEITNTHDKIPYNEDGTITVNKYWYDENDKYKKRPGSITVNLLADGEIYASAELTAENEWTYTFEHLPKYTIRDGEVGCEIVYSIEEVAVEFYETTIDGFDIHNTYNGPVPEITPPPTGVMMKKSGRNNNVLFEMILTLLATSYTVVVARKNEQ